MEVPAPVARFLEVAFPEGAPKVETAALEGTGRFWLRRSPWIPFENTISFRPGRDRVSDMFVRLGPFTLFRVLDAYVDGHGITKVLRKADVGDEIDQGALHPMLVEALMVPSCWSEIAGFSWEAADGTSARIIVPFAGGTERATVRFDARTGFPSLYETPRFKKVGGPKV
ncbi:MAG TPA: DUF6544 family protein, partial [Actinomycetota bacterium]|nr:DUF6544 family protein [Actinomycetota bacterium]